MIEREEKENLIDKHARESAIRCSWGFASRNCAGIGGSNIFLGDEDREAFFLSSYPGRGKSKVHPADSCSKDNRIK